MAVLNDLVVTGNSSLIGILKAQQIKTNSITLKTLNATGSVIVGTNITVGGTGTFNFISTTGVDVKDAYYPKFSLLPSEKNSTGVTTRAMFEGNYGDSVCMWVNTNSSTDTHSRRGLVVYGYGAKSDATQAVALRQCNTSGTWLDDLYLIHSGGGTITGNLTISGLKAATSSTGTSKGLGSSGQVLSTNGTNAYWRSVSDKSAPGHVSSSSTNLVTERAVYYSLPKFNGSTSYNSDTPYYAPTSVGSSGNILVSSGSGAPTWKSPKDAGVFSISGDTRGLTVNRGTNDRGYYLVAQASISTWSNRRSTWLVSSRHSGAGILQLNYGCNASALSPTNAYCSIQFIGTTTGISPTSSIKYSADENVMYDDAFVAFASADGATIYLFAKYTDYDKIALTPLHSSDSAGANTFQLISDGAWIAGETISSIPAATYGTFIGKTVAGPNYVSNALHLYRDTTIAKNEPACLNFWVKQTDNNVSNRAFIAAYDDLDTAGNGLNMVINATSGLYLTAGEGARDYLQTYPSTAEQVHICADSTIYFHTNCNTTTSATSSVYINTSGVLMGAAWNDYAEYRVADSSEPGRVVIEQGDDSLSLSTDRLQPGANIISDTFGFSIGQTERANTPIAVSGRVLAYTWEPRETFAAGDPVCSGPNGTVSKMTREEVMMYPDRMLGTVSAIPNYETWGETNVSVNGRIWIKIK